MFLCSKKYLTQKDVVEKVSSNLTQGKVSEAAICYYNDKAIVIALTPRRASTSHARSLSYSSTPVCWSAPATSSPTWRT